MQAGGGGVICFSAAVWGPADLHGWSPVASGLFNLDLLLPSHHIVVIALILHPRRLNTSPPKPSVREFRVPWSSACDGNFPYFSISAAHARPLEILMTCGCHFK